MLYIAIFLLVGVAAEFKIILKLVHVIDLQEFLSRPVISLSFRARSMDRAKALVKGGKCARLVAGGAGEGGLGRRR